VFEILILCSTSQLADGKTFKFSAQLKSPDQALLFHVACEQIGMFNHPTRIPADLANQASYTAGTWSSSELKPNVEASMFPKDLPKPLPPRPPAQKADNPSNPQFKQPLPQKTLASSGKPQPFINEPNDEDYGDDSIFDDIDFFHDIDDFKKPPSRKNTDAMGRPSYSLNHNSAPIEGSQPTRTPTAQSVHEQEEGDEAEQLPNGKWKCRHKCGDRTK
jgi:ATP-dependent DNA helicase HFM1/MER3